MLPKQPEGLGMAGQPVLFRQVLDRKMEMEASDLELPLPPTSPCDGSRRPRAAHYSEKVGLLLLVSLGLAV